MHARCTVLQLMGMGHAAALQAGRERELGQPGSGPPLVDSPSHGIVAHVGGQPATVQTGGKRERSQAGVQGRGRAQHVVLAMLLPCRRL